MTLHLPRGVSFDCALPQRPPTVYGRASSSIPARPTNVHYYVGGVQGGYYDAQGRAHEPTFTFLVDPADLARRRRTRDQAGPATKTVPRYDEVDDEKRDARSRRSGSFETSPRRSSFTSTRHPTMDEIFPLDAPYSFRSSFEMPPRPVPVIRQPEVVWPDRLYPDMPEVKEKEERVPTCAEVMTRQWQLLVLRFRFAVYRQQQKFQQKFKRKRPL